MAGAGRSGTVIAQGSQSYANLTSPILVKSALPHSQRDDNFRLSLTLLNSSSEVAAEFTLLGTSLSVAANLQQSLQAAIEGGVHWITSQSIPS